MRFLKVLGITAAALLAAGVAMNWGDIRRYIKIESM